MIYLSLKNLWVATFLVMMPTSALLAECRSPQNYTSLYFDRYNTWQAAKLRVIFIDQEMFGLGLDIAYRQQDLKKLQRLHSRGLTRPLEVEVAQIALERVKLEHRRLERRIKAAQNNIELLRLRMKAECSDDIIGFRPETLVLQITGLKLRWQAEAVDRTESSALDRRDLLVAIKRLEWVEEARRMGGQNENDVINATNEKKIIEYRVKALESANDLSRKIIETLNEFLEVFENIP